MSADCHVKNLRSVHGCHEVSTDVVAIGDVFVHVAKDKRLVGANMINVMIDDGDVKGDAVFDRLKLSTML